jgi:hypothetical protein
VPNALGPSDPEPRFNALPTLISDEVAYDPVGFRRIGEEVAMALVGQHDEFRIGKRD